MENFYIFQNIIIRANEWRALRAIFNLFLSEKGQQTNSNWPWLDPKSKHAGHGHFNTSKSDALLSSLCFQECLMLLCGEKSKKNTSQAFPFIFLKNRCLLFLFPPFFCWSCLFQVQSKDGSTRRHGKETSYNSPQSDAGETPGSNNILHRQKGKGKQKR